MNEGLEAAARAAPLIALMLSACVSQSAYDRQAQALQQARAKIAVLETRIANMQRHGKWVIAGDLLFPEGGYQLSQSGKTILDQYAARLRSLQNAKVVVYGYTDSRPIEPGLRRLGIKDNFDLSSRRADSVVAYFLYQGVNPNVLSAKGFGDTHPVASNDTAAGRAQNRRIEIVLEGPGA